MSGRTFELEAAAMVIVVVTISNVRAHHLFRPDSVLEIQVEVSNGIRYG